MRYLLFLTILLIPSYAYSFGLNGQTWRIAEPNLLKEIRNAAKHVNYKKLHRRGKKLIMDYYPKYDGPLPPSSKSYVFYHKYIYTLKQNIPYVKDGKIIGDLYKAGYKFAPLKYMPFKLPTYVIFDIKNKYQRRWVFKTFGKNPAKYKLLTTEGNLKTLIPYIKKYKIPVFYDMRALNRIFGVKNTVSIVSRSHIFIKDFKVRVVGMDAIKREEKLWKKRGKR